MVMKRLQRRLCEAIVGQEPEPMYISRLFLSTTDSLQGKKAKTNRGWIGEWNPEDYPGEHPRTLCQPADVCQQARGREKTDGEGGGFKENRVKDMQSR